ncbi:ankyrin repeat domain-containing protein 31-like isoform X2 [Chelmon rostratus]|nr:ankyrin repeat domain-containing protein 31-like isoform X2 [Chelmon rostratus]
MQLVEVYETMKAKLCIQPLNHPQRDHLSAPASTPASSKAREAHSHKDLTVPRPPAPLLTKGKEALTHTDGLNERGSSCQSSAPQPGNTSQHVNFQMKRKFALIQTRAEDNSRHLSKLIQRGVLPSGSTLQLFLKGHRHLAQVLGDCLIKDSKGKLHLAPERWLESILGNNIPVSSAYAWDKVTFRDKPLSYYLLNMEAEGNTPQTCPGDCSAGSSQGPLTTVSAKATSLNRLMKIKIIHLVDDEELLPTAVLDCYWEKLLNKDHTESEDWGNELL